MAKAKEADSDRILKSFTAVVAALKELDWDDRIAVLKAYVTLFDVDPDALAAG